jgi:uncharacterized RDD family membrane protein YckC
MENNQLARFRYRFLAVMLDGLLIQQIGLAIALAIIYFLKISDINLITYGALGIFFCVGIVLDFLSNVVLARLTNGKSLGKGLVGIRIVTVDNSKLTLWKLIKRWGVFVGMSLTMSYFFYPVSLVIMRKSPLKQGLHDRASQTLVVNSKTSSRKKLVSWFVYILLIVISTIALAFYGVGVARNFVNELTKQMNDSATSNFSSQLDALKKQAADLEKNAVSLSGEKGPLATLNNETFTEGLSDYNDAIDFSERDDFLSARIEIDEAFEKNPRSKLIQAQRCYIYTMFESSDDTSPRAYSICKEAYAVAPNDPTVIGNMIVNAYYVDKCNEIGDAAIALSNIRMGSNYTSETKSTIYGEAGVHILACGINDELGVKMVQKGIELTNNYQYKKYYQDYLDEYLGTI